MSVNRCFLCHWNCDWYIKCWNWENWVLFCLCYGSWIIPIICTASVFLSVRKMCQLLIVPLYLWYCSSAWKSQGGLQGWCSGLKKEGWNPDLYWGSSYNRKCQSDLSWFSKTVSWMETLSGFICVGCGYRVGCGERATSFFSFPLLSCGFRSSFLSHAVWVLSLNPDYLFSPEIRGLTDAVSLLGLAELPAAV